MDYLILKGELALPVYSGIDADACVVLLNDKIITAKQAITALGIQQYLALISKLVPIENSIEDEAKEATRALDIFSEFDVSDVAVESKLISILDGLIVLSLLANEDKTAILAMGDKLISRAKELGLPMLISSNINHARSL